MTELGSPPSAPRTSSAPERSAHVPNCSAAAARKVSPAASTSERPSCACCADTLPMVVVLPTPFTPTNNHTLMRPSSSCAKFNSRFAPSRREVISRCRAISNSSAVVISLAFTRPRSESSSASVTPMPTSAFSNASSRSSHVSLVIPPRARTPPKTPANDNAVLPQRLFGGAGASTTGVSTTAVSTFSMTGVEVTGFEVTGLTPAPPLDRRFSTTTPSPKTTATTNRINKRFCAFIPVPLY